MCAGDVGNSNKITFSAILAMGANSPADIKIASRFLKGDAQFIIEQGLAHLYRIRRSRDDCNSRQTFAA
jgi:hypothetical protein